MHDPSAAVTAIRELLGPGGTTDRPEELRPYLQDWRGREGQASLLAWPRDRDQVAAVLRLCREAGIGVVPQGANTGLCGGATPRHPQLLLNLERMNRVSDVDAAGYTLTAEAGCTLRQLQDVARDANRLFALSLAGGRSQIGGCMSTNAGGTNVLRYGNARDQVLGLEVVLPDGRVLDRLRRLRKDNTGYDLKQWFIGAEGTLGVITKVCCRLYPLPAVRETVLLAVDDPDAALALLAALRERLGDGLTACEFWPQYGLELVLRHIADTHNPFPALHPWYLLLEYSRFDADGDARLPAQLQQPAIRRWWRAANLAQNEEQRAHAWRLRENLSLAQKRDGANIKHDVSVPLAAVPEFLAGGEALLARLMPGGRVLAFGHLGDGNIHFNVGSPPDLPVEPLLARWEEIAGAVHDWALACGGSFSAEHGIGRLKVGELRRLSADLDLELMRGLKRLLDPTGIMNPGKVLDDAG